MLEKAQDEEEVRRRLDGLIRARPGASYAAASRLLGRNHAYVQQFIRRGQPRRLSLQDTRRLAEWLAVPVAHLLPREDEAVLKTAGIGPCDLVHLPLLDDADGVAASATERDRATEDGRAPKSGRGRRPPTDPGNLALPRRQIEGWLERPAECLALVRVNGDSMSPTLADGDLVIVDATVRQIVGDGLYLLRINGASPLLRRLTVSPSGRMVTVSCDNPAYRRWTDLAPDRIRVCGRALACLHRF